MAVDPTRTSEKVYPRADSATTDSPTLTSTIRYATWRADEQYPKRPLEVLADELRSIPVPVWIEWGAIWAIRFCAVRAPRWDVIYLRPDRIFVMLPVFIFCVAQIIAYLVRSAHTWDTKRKLFLEPYRDGPEESQLPVEVEVFREEVCIGSDLGFLSIGETPLYYSGTDTSFGFSRRAVPNLRDAHPGIEADFERDGVRYSVRIRSLSLELGGDPMWNVREQWGKAVVRLRTVEVLPPTQVNSSARQDAVERWVRRHFVPSLLLYTPLLALCDPFVLSYPHAKMLPTAAIAILWLRAVLILLNNLDGLRKLDSVKQRRH